MRQGLVGVVFAVGLVGAMGADGEAQVHVPAPDLRVCIAFEEFDNVMELFFRPISGSQLIGSGRDNLSGGGVSATAMVVGNIALLSYTKPLPPTPGPFNTIHSVMGSAAISLAAQRGPGRCETINFNDPPPPDPEKGCASGRPATARIVPCDGIAFPFPGGTVPGGTSIRLMEGSGPSSER